MTLLQTYFMTKCLKKTQIKTEQASLPDCDHVRFNATALKSAASL